MPEFCVALAAMAGLVLLTVLCAILSALSVWQQFGDWLDRRRRKS